MTFSNLLFFVYFYFVKLKYSSVMKIKVEWVIKFSTKVWWGIISLGKDQIGIYTSDAGHPL